LGALVSIFN